MLKCSLDGNPRHSKLERVHSRNASGEGTEFKGGGGGGENNFLLTDRGKRPVRWSTFLREVPGGRGQLDNQVKKKQEVGQKKGTGKVFLEAGRRRERGIRASWVIGRREKVQIKGQQGPRANS